MILQYVIMLYCRRYPTFNITITSIKRLTNTRLDEPVTNIVCRSLSVSSILKSAVLSLSNKLQFYTCKNTCNKNIVQLSRNDTRDFPFVFAVVLFPCCDIIITYNVSKYKFTNILYKMNIYAKNRCIGCIKLHIYAIFLYIY